MILIQCNSALLTMLKCRMPVVKDWSQCQEQAFLEGIVGKQTLGRPRAGKMQRVNSTRSSGHCVKGGGLFLCGVQNQDQSIKGAQWDQRLIESSCGLSFPETRSGIPEGQAGVG